ncbi:MAG: fucose isomerase [Clostridia bacterium]|nr:fucose isomerase [Clostridia bacterium]
MLKGIPKIISPALLKILDEMGHGDEIVIADLNFPSENYGKRVIRAEAAGGEEMLRAVMDLIPLDDYVDDNFVFIETPPSYTEEPPIWASYRQIANERDKNVSEKQIDRLDFYERTKSAYAVIATGEEALYACVILKKGVFRT